MSYIYIAIPYTHEDPNVVEERVNIAMAYCAKVFNEGNYAFSVVVHCHEMSKKFNMPKTYDFWQYYCEEMIKYSDAVHLLEIDGAEESVGCKGELELAEKHDVPVITITSEELDML